MTIQKWLNHAKENGIKTVRLTKVSEVANENFSINSEIENVEVLCEDLGIIGRLATPLDDYSSELRRNGNYYSLIGWA